MLLQKMFLGVFASFAFAVEEREKKQLLVTKHAVNPHGFCQEYFLGNTLIRTAESDQEEFQKWIKFLPLVVADLNPFHMLKFLDIVIEQRLVSAAEWKEIDRALQRDYVWLVTLASVMYKEYGFKLGETFKKMIVKEERKFLFDHQPGDNGNGSYEMRCRQKEYVVRFERWNSKAGIFTSIYYWKDKILSWREFFWAQRLQHVKRYWEHTDNRLEIDARKMNDYLMRGKIGQDVKYELRLDLKQVQDFVENDEKIFEAVGKWELNGICMVRGLMINFIPLMDKCICKNLDNENEFYLEALNGRTIGMDLQLDEIFEFGSVHFPVLQKTLGFGCKRQDSQIEFGIVQKGTLHGTFNLSGRQVRWFKSEVVINLNFELSMCEEQMLTLYRMAHIILAEEATGFVLFKAKDQLSIDGQSFKSTAEKGWRFQNESNSAFVQMARNEEISFSLSTIVGLKIEGAVLQEYFVQLLQIKND